MGTERLLRPPMTQEAEALFHATPAKPVPDLIREAEMTVASIIIVLLLDKSGVVIVE